MTLIGVGLRLLRSPESGRLALKFRLQYPSMGASFTVREGLAESRTSPLRPWWRTFGSPIGAAQDAALNVKNSKNEFLRF